jgi:hypothetical protein
VAARTIREDLANAASLLTTQGDLLDKAGNGVEAEQYYDAASAVRAALAPGGWTVLKDSDPDVGRLVNLAVQMDAKLKKDLEQAVQVFGKPFPVLAAEALSAIVHGRWTPSRLPVLRGPKTNLNVRVPAPLKDEAAARASALTDEVGYRVSLASTVTMWMVEELGVDVSGTDVMRLIVPKPFADHIRAKAEEQDTTLEEVLAEQIRALEAGSYWPKLKERPRNEAGLFNVTTGTDQTWGKDLPVSKLTLRLDASLLDVLRGRTEEITAAAGWPGWPSMVATAMLRDRLGEPE